MSFNSLEFLIYFPVVSLVYFLIPANKSNKIRNLWLLCASYYFYMSWNAKYLILILISTIITYVCGISIERIKTVYADRKSKEVLYKKICVISTITANLCILGFFKYGQFILNNIDIFVNKVGLKWNKPVLNILLPVGISFYTFQAIGYIIDVYRGDTEAEKDFIDYALFVSFFPQLVAGPIERSKNLLVQFKKRHFFDLYNIREGLLVMLWGFFMKLVIADRVAAFVDTVYGNHTSFGGWYLIIATFFAGIQVYCDFNGYTMIARGAAKIIGFDLMENFDAPFLSSSIGELWRRWHISLTGWFRDYIYMPLVKSNKVRKQSKFLRKKFGKQVGQLYLIILTTLCVWFLTGLWHGAGWGFIIWGLFNGFYIVMGEILRPVRNKISEICNINPYKKGNIFVKVLFTNLLYASTVVFFRSEGISDAISIYKSIFSFDNVWILFDHESIYNCGINRSNFVILIFSLIILLCADLCKARKISILNAIYSQDLWFRWSVYAISFFFVLIFGIWGSKYTNVAFVYFNF